jgi:N6-L-threonylcarbamoyladenine synthase
MLILGIETSCDETAAAVYDGAARRLLAHRLHSQTAIHAPFGGVVPELASRDHLVRLLPIVRCVLADAGLGSDGQALQAVAYTAGPGLVGALLVGSTVAAGLAAAWGKPAIPVHHMEAHLLAPLLEPDPPAFPFLALLVSGGHTMLVDVQGVGCYRILGQTLDDAAGEAFDKTAKLLGLPYPGGPNLARLAGDEAVADRFRFPRPLVDRPGLDFSFSGLKTAVMLKVRELSGPDGLTKSDTRDLARSFQNAAVDTLVSKCLQAVRQTGLRRVVVAGGVGANRRLRAALSSAVAASGVSVHYPRSEFCTDNAAMVALAGALRAGSASAGQRQFFARARWDLEELRAP